MSRECEFCGKRTHTGNTIKWHGKAKREGGVGLKVHGISKREFRPNIQVVRAIINGAVRRVKICTHCLRMGKVQKAAH